MTCSDKEPLEPIPVGEIRLTVNPVIPRNRGSYRVGQPTRYKPGIQRMGQVETIKRYRGKSRLRKKLNHRRLAERDET